MARKAKRRKSVKSRKSATPRKPRTVKPKPPPQLSPPRLESSEAKPWSGEAPPGPDAPPSGKWANEAEAAIYSQLLEVRKLVEDLQHEAQETKAGKSMALVPVRVGDLMQGFQAAVVRANRATRAGAAGGEDIEQMSIKDLEITLNASIIDSGHADDPIVMLPNIKSADGEAAAITLKFGVVSVPVKQR